MPNFSTNPPIVKSNNGNSVAAKWLTDINGSYIIDLATSSPYIVPADFDLQKFISNFKSFNVAANGYIDINIDPYTGNASDAVYNNLTRSGFVTGVLVGFAPGGKYDIQRTYNGTSTGLFGSNVGGWSAAGAYFVSDFRSSASFVFGVACNNIGITENDCLAGGGLTKFLTNLKDPQKIGKFSDYLNPPDNAANIRAGYSYINTTNSSGASSTSAIVAPPSNALTRSSANLVTVNNTAGTSFTVKSGGAVWDAYALQKNKSSGFNDWNEYQVAIQVSNPDISDIGNVQTGQVIYQPQKWSDGALLHKSFVRMRLAPYPAF